MFEEKDFFLNVEKSVGGRAWIDRLSATQMRTATAMSQQYGISEILARILAGRDVPLDATEEFLLPTLRDLMPDPSTVTQMDALVERLVQAVENGENVALFGDYDVDGASSCALMTRYLRGVGLAPATYIPDRIFEATAPISRPWII